MAKGPLDSGWLNDRDAIKVIKVAAEADGGCSHCFEECMNIAVEQWPDVQWARLVREADFLEAGQVARAKYFTTRASVED